MMVTMKHLLIPTFTACLLLAPMTARGDVLMPDTHVVRSCIKIVNINDYPEYVIIGFVTGPMIPTYESSIVDSAECLTKGYKFNDFKLCAMRKDLLGSRLLSEIDCRTDAVVLPDLEVQVGADPVDDSNPLIREDRDYTITSISESALHLRLSRKEMEYSDGRPVETQYFNAASSSLSSAASSEGSSEAQHSEAAMSSSSSAALSTGFRDVPTSHPYATAIGELQSEQIVRGYPDGTFKPDNPINRAEFLKIIIESQKQSGGQGAAAPCTPSGMLSDVANDAWYASYVCEAQRSGIISGYPDGTFRPSNRITFAEAAKIIANSHADEPLTPTPGSAWYQVYIQFLSTHGAVPTTVHANDQQITRGEMAEMMWQLNPSPSE